MREELKDILLMGLGALSLTNDKAKELKEELLKEGTKVYEQGKIKNEELKHHLKENLSVVIGEKNITKEEIIGVVKNMSNEERKELLTALESEKANNE